MNLKEYNWLFIGLAFSLILVGLFLSLYNALYTICILLGIILFFIFKNKYNIKQDEESKAGFNMGKHIIERDLEEYLNTNLTQTYDLFKQSLANLYDFEFKETLTGISISTLILTGIFTIFIEDSTYIAVPIIILILYSFCIGYLYHNLKKIQSKLYYNYNKHSLILELNIRKKMIEKNIDETIKK